MALDLKRLLEEAEKQVKARLCETLNQLVATYRAQPLVWPIARDVLKKSLDKYLKECGITI